MKVNFAPVSSFAETSKSSMPGSSPHSWQSASSGSSSSPKWLLLLLSPTSFHPPIGYPALGPKREGDVRTGRAVVLALCRSAPPLFARGRV